MNELDPLLDRDLRSLPDRRAPAGLTAAVRNRLRENAAWEARLTQDLAAIPLQSAPSRLREKVRARLAIRLQVPWWQKTWDEWNLWQRSLVGSVAFAAGTILTLSESRLGIFEPWQTAWAWAQALWQGCAECALRVPLPMILGLGLFLSALVFAAFLGAVVLLAVWNGEEAHGLA